MSNYSKWKGCITFTISQKKKLGVEFIFCMHQSLYKLALSCFMEMELLKKKVSQMQNIHMFYGRPAMFIVTCFSVLLVSQWSKHFLTWLLVFSNSKILSVLILLGSIPSLNWVIKLLNWVTVSLLEIVIRCIPENNLVGQLYHNVGFIESFQFCVSLIALYSYL